MARRVIGSAAARQAFFNSQQPLSQTVPQGGGGGAFQDIIQQMQAAQEKANLLNEQRYQQMLGITDQTTGQRASDIRRDFSGQQSDMMQRLASLGMSNTTIAPTLGAGIERNKQAALDRSADSLQGTKLGIMERRTDAYPQSNMIMQLVQALGQGGGPKAAGNIAQALGSMRLG